jgi:DNA-binding response OmpR family regulator
MTDAVVPPNTTVSRKVVFADFSIIKFQAVMDWLLRENIVSEGATETTKVVNLISEEMYDVVVVNLLLGGTGPFEMISHLRSCSKNKDIKIIVISRQVQKVNIQNTIRAGANDFVADPFDNENLQNRIVYHMSPKQVIEPAGFEQIVAGQAAWDYVKLMLETTELMSRSQREKTHAAFYTVLQGIAKLLESNRTSLIIVDEKSNSGVVLATSDDPKFFNFPIQLNKYPEIMHVMHTGNLVVVEDVSQNAMTEAIARTVRSIAIGSLLVFPIRFQADILGVMTIRRKNASQIPSLDIMRVLQAIGNIMGAHYNIEALLRRVYRDFKKSA